LVFFSPKTLEAFSNCSFQLSKNSREEIQKIFKLFDEDNIGKIQFRNLKKVSMELGEGLTDEELQEMIDEADRGL
jgi:centrin-1